MIWFAIWLLCTIGSSWYAISIIGDKYRKDKWYDYILIAPSFQVMLVLRLLAIIKDKREGNHSL